LFLDLELTLRHKICKNERNPKKKNSTGGGKNMEKVRWGVMGTADIARVTDRILEQIGY